jgi:hypothetical protein
MNLYEKYTLFKQLLDEVLTTRVDIQEFVSLTNLAINDIVQSRIDPIKDAQSSGIYIQSVQRVREELKFLIKESPITLVGNVIQYPDDYKHYLLLRIFISNVLVTAKPVTFDWLGANLDNPHTKPSDTRIKFVEKNTGIELYKGSSAITAGTSRLEYIAEPIKVEWDETAKTSATTFTEDVTIVVVLGSITYNGNVYTVGQDVFIDVSVAASFTGTGTANIIVNTELPLYLHREIVRKAVSIQLSIIGDNNRKQTIEFDEKSS